MGQHHCESFKNRKIWKNDLRKKIKRWRHFFKLNYSFMNFVWTESFSSPRAKWKKIKLKNNLKNIFFVIFQLKRFFSDKKKHRSNNWKFDKTIRKTRLDTNNDVFRNFRNFSQQVKNVTYSHFAKNCYVFSFEKFFLT